MGNNLVIETLQSKTGKEILKVNGYYLHSKFDPEKEALRMAEKIYVPHHVHIIFGYGRGYLVDALQQTFKFKEKLIVVDPLLDNQKITVQKAHEKMVIFNSSVIEEFDLHIKSFIGDVRTQFQVFCIPNYEKIFLESYKKILQKVKDLQLYNQVNDFTLSIYSEQWQRNFTDNLFHIQDDFSLNLLKEAYSCPVIIASSGPSLNKQIPLLKKIRDKVIVVASGTTIKPLIAEGVMPDYIISLDPAEENYLVFKDFKFDQAKLIYITLNHPKVRNSFEQSAYVTETTGWKYLSKYTSEKLNLNLPILRAGGSVANLALTVAQYITTGPIALIGQDLAFTNNATHASNHSESEVVEEDYLKKIGAFLVEGYYEEKVWTSPPLNAMKIDFEVNIQNNPPKMPVFNCTEGGAKIKGIEQIPFKQFCQEYVKPIKVEIVEHTEDDKIKLNAVEVLENEIRIYTELIELFKNGLKSLESNKSNEGFSNKILKRLDKIEVKSKSLFEKVPVEVLVAPITLKVLRGYLPKENETKQETYKRVYNQTKDLYLELISVLEKTKLYNEYVVKKKKEA